MPLSDQQRERAVAHFKSVQKQLGEAFAAIDGQAAFEYKSWDRPVNPSGVPGGGGTMGVIRGQVVEKAGANVSVVRGDEYPAIEGEHKGKPFFAAGISTICHMFNPHAPIAHMNVRLLEVGDTFWVGGGADLTPFKVYDDDTRDFHAAMESACKGQGPDAYAKYKQWCAEYFYIPHRQSERGVGGIFFDYLKGDFARLIDFLTAVTDAYIKVYPEILRRRRDMPFTAEDKEGQLYWRGRYAEFNLAWDRGTKFGLMTGGNIEAIFVSLPPVVKW
jgi:coproporphyrinogen III oxidase